MMNRNGTMRCWFVLALLLSSTMLSMAALNEQQARVEAVQQDDSQMKGFERIELTKLDPVSRAGGRAACPALQTDGGTTGDAAGDNTTTKSLGSDPTFSGKTGCVDANDRYDYYSFQMSAGKDSEFEMTVPAPVDNGSGVGNDFDLHIEDSNGNIIDYAWTYDAVEKVTTAGSTGSGVAGTYYLAVEHYNGDGIYSIDGWTNSSVPRPDPSIDSPVSNITSAAVGDSMELTYTITNNGPADLNTSYDIFFLLTDNSTWTWEAIETSSGGEFTVSGPLLSANQSQMMTTQVPISDNVPNGTYVWSVWVDGYDNLTESNENNNEGWGTQNITIGQPLNCSVLGADAGSGSDAGANASTALSLGPGYTGTVTGCFDAGDAADFYSVDILDGQELSAHLDAEEGADNDLYLFDSKEEMVNFSYQYGEVDENASTIGTNWSQLAGTYFIAVYKWAGEGEYSLHIWTNGSGPPPPSFDCVPEDDMGLGADAGETPATATTLGDNPTVSGMGCLDRDDSVDTYSFSLSGMAGVDILLDQDPGQDFGLSIANGQGIQLVTIYNFGQPIAFNTSTISPADLAGNYLLSVINNGSDGTYNLSLSSIAPPLPDLAATSVTCPEVLPGDPTDVWTGSEFTFSVTGDSLGGPSSTPFDWEFTLIAENGTGVVALLNGTYGGTLAGMDGEIISASGMLTLGDEIPSGNYSCRLAIDADNAIAEADETNNVLDGANFSITNLDEYWADDVDRDGIPNDEDDCPNSGGNSTEDKLGCQDLDGDGWSNQGDDFFTEPTQWRDSDGDNFGDNPTGYQGDQCPNEAGVAAGTNGTGCPVWNPDSDADGVIDSQDLCPGTAPGVVVDETGCEPTPVIEEPEPADKGDDSTDGEDDSIPLLGNAFGENTMLIAGIGGAVLLLLIILMTVMLLRRGGKDGGSMIQEQAWAVAISPEQQQYEQQLIAMGYTPEQARQYASQHFD